MASQTMLDRAIIIKGPTPESKSYFTGLPGSLDELVQKATKLFPLPPNHSGHLLLDNDAILMPDVLPFLKDREVLTFKWTANTPRSSLRQPLRAEDVARQPGSSGSSSSSHGDSINGSGGSAGSRTSRNVRWDSSVLSATQEKAQATAVSNNSSRTSSGTHSAGFANPTHTMTARPYRYSAAARAEHSRRVLNEQEQLRRADSKNCEQSAPEMAGENTQSTGKTNSSSPQGDNAFKLVSANANSAQQQSLSISDDQAEPNVNSSSPTIDASASAETATGQDPANPYDEQQNSSPVASPTRNIRGAQKSINGWMTPLGSDSKSDAETKADIRAEKEFSDREAQVVPCDADSLDSTAKDTLVEKTAKNGALQYSTDVTAVAPAAAQDVPGAEKTQSNFSPSGHAKAVRIQTTYQRMSSVIDALRSHPSNRFFHGTKENGSMACVEWTAFLQRNGRPLVDFDTIANKLQLRKYGLDDPFVGFAADLGQMWSNTRAFFGPQSAEAQCADFLDRFSRIITVEWRKEADGRGRQQDTEGDAAFSKEQAMARAAKLLHNMTYGATHKVNNNKKAMPSGHNKSKTNTVRTAVNKPDRPTDIFAPLAPRQQVKPREQSTSPRATKLGVDSVALSNKAGDKISELNFTPRTQAFLATMFAKKPSTAQPTSASSDMMAKLQQQFGPLSSVASAASANSQSSGTRRELVTSKNRGVKRPAPSPTHTPKPSGDNRPAKKVQVQSESALADRIEAQAKDTAATASEEASLAVPVVTVTDDESMVNQDNDVGPHLHAEVGNGSALVTDERAVEAALGLPLADQSRKSIVVEGVAGEAKIHDWSPRRSSRQSAPSTKVLEAQRHSPANNNRRSPLAVSPSQRVTAAVKGAEKPSTEKAIATPQRMVTRRSTAAKTSDSRRTRRATAAV